MNCEIFSRILERWNNLNEDNHSHENNIIKCQVTDCNFQFTVSKYSKQFDLDRIARHIEYHRELEAVNKTYLRGWRLENGEEVVFFPCSKCDVEPFQTYDELSDHQNHLHPDFTLKCRDRSCAFSTWSKQYRAKHWQRIHECREHTCDVCGKSFKGLFYFHTHMQTHDKSNQATCDICGKVFPTLKSLETHTK